MGGRQPVIGDRMDDNGAKVPVEHLQLVRDGSEEVAEVIRSIVLDDDGGTR